MQGEAQTRGRQHTSTKPHARRGGGSTRVIGVLSDEPDETDYPSQLMLDDNYGEDLGVWFYVFYVVFCYVVLIMLLNLLIAMMGNTCTFMTIKPSLRPG